MGFNARQIVLKLANPHTPDPTAAVAHMVRAVVSARDVKVEPVFPGVTTGRRAGTMVLTLDGKVSAAQFQAVLDALQRSKLVTYAEPSAAKSMA